MEKYAISKLSVILYHKTIDLSIGFIKFLEKIFSESPLGNKKDKRKPLSWRVKHALITAVVAVKFLLLLHIFE